MGEHNALRPTAGGRCAREWFLVRAARVARVVRAFGWCVVRCRSAGEATDVVPDSCELQGTVRTFSTDVLDMIERRMQQVAEHVCAAHEAQCEFEFVRNYPPTVNTADEAAFAREVMVSIVGESNVEAQEPTMGAEDFAYMLQAKPGAYCFIANGDGTHRDMGHGAGPCVLHNPSYDFNDDLIPLGATYWVRLAEEWLAKGRA